MSERILYVKVYNMIDPFGKRLVEKIILSESGQKFIKQYYLSQTELTNFMEQCRMSNIRVELSNSLGDDSFLTTQFSPMNVSNNSKPQYDPSTTYRSSITTSQPKKINKPTVELPPSSLQGYTHENFVDFQDSSNFGGCMMFGGGNTSSR